MPLPLDYEDWPRSLLLKIVGEAGQLPDDQQRFFNKATAAGIVTPIGQVNPRAINAQMRSMSEEDVDALPDATAQAYANVAMKADSGSSSEFNDWDGKMRYGAEFKGQALLKRYMHEINPERYAAMFPNKVSEWEGLENDEAKLKHAWENMDKVQRDTKFAYKDVKQTTSFGIGPEFTPREANRNDLTSTPKQFDDLTAVDKKELLQIGKFDAIAQSFSPMRKHLKSRLQSSPGAWEFANKQLEKILQGGKIDIDSLSIFDKEQQRYIVDYIRHVRPRQGSEGWAGAFGDAGRSFLDGTISPIVGGIVDLPGQASTNLYDLIIGSADDDGLTFKESYDQLNKLEQTAGIADSYKPQIREGLQGTLVKTSATLPFMAYVAASPVTFGLTGYLAGSGVANQTRNSLIADGVDPDIAGAAGVASGTLAVTVERFMGVAGKFGLSNAPSRRLMANIMTNHILKRAARKFVLTSAEEFTEELIEAVGNEFIQQAAYGDKRQLKTMWGNAWSDAKESGDVVLALSAFGLAGRSAAEVLSARISKNRSQESENQRSMDEMDVKRRQMIEENPGLVNQIVKEDLQSVSRAWSELKTDEEKTNFLRKSGVQPTELDKAEKVMDAAAAEIGLEDAAVTEAEASIPDDASAGFTEVTQEVVDSIKQEAAQYADEVVVQNDVLDADGVARQALYKDGKIIISSSIEGDANLIVREEIGHGLFPKLAQDELAFIKSEQEALVAQTGVDVNYADVDSVTQLEEAFAKKFAEYTPKQRTLVQKFIDWIKSILPINKDGKFENIDQVMQSIEARERGADTGKSGQAERASRFTKANVRALAQRIALGRLAEGRSINADQLRKMFPSEAFQEAGLAEDLINEAKEEIASITEFESDVLKRGAQFTEAARKREVRRARKEAGKLARESFKAEKVVKQKIAAAEKRARESNIAKQRRKAKSVLPPQYKDSIKQNEYYKEAIETGDTTKLFADIDNATEAYATRNDITDRKAKDSIYKHTLYHALWFNGINKVKHGRLRSVIITQANKVRADKSTVKTANSSANKIIGQLNRISSISARNDVKSDFRAIVGAKANQRVSNKTLLKDRTITPQKAAELSLIKSVWKRKESVTSDMLNEVDEAILYEQGSNKLTVQEKQEATVNKMAKKMGAINDKSYQGMDNTQKLQILRDVLTRYGALSSQPVNVISEAIIELDTELAGDMSSMADLAKGQAEMANINKNRMMLATSSAVKGKKSKFEGGALFGSVQNRLRDFTRIAADENKVLIEDVIRDLQFQKASRELDNLRLNMSAQWQETFREAYGVGAVKSQLKLDEINTRMEKYNKYHPRGEAMSKGQLMQLYSTWRQDGYKDNINNTGFSDETMEQMYNEFSIADKVFMDGLVDTYQEWGAQLDEVSMRVYGVPMSNNTENYMPVVIGQTKPYSAVDVRSIPLLPPSFNERVSSSAKVDIEPSIFEVLDGKIRQNSHWISHVESSMLARSVFSDKEIAAQMEANYGKDAASKLYDHLNDVYSDSAIDAFDSKFVRKLSSTLSLRYLSGSLKQPFTQATSISAFALQLGIGNNLRMVGHSAFGKPSVSYGQAMSAMWNSDQFNSRKRIGQTEFIQNAMRESVGKDWVDQLASPDGAKVATKQLFRAIKQAYKLGMITNTVGDAIPIMIIGPSIYQNELARYDGNEQLAMDSTWDIIESTQQSHAVKDRSILSRRGGSLGLLIGQFVNTPGQYAAFEAQAYKQWRDDVHLYGFADAMKRESTKNLANALFINHVMLPGMFATVGSIFYNILGADEWDEEDTAGLVIQMAQGPLTSNMIGSALTEEFLNAAWSGKSSFGRGLIPLDAFRQDAALFGKFINHMIKSIKTGDDFDKALNDAIKLTTSFTAPTRQARQAIESR